MVRGASCATLAVAFGSSNPFCRAQEHVDFISIQAMLFNGAGGVARRRSRPAALTPSAAQVLLATGGSRRACWFASRRA